MKTYLWLKKTLEKAGPVLFWMGLWFLVSFIVAHPLFLPSPQDVLSRLVELLQDKNSYIRLFSSCLRILAGFSLAFFSGIFLAYLAWRSRTFERYLRPAVEVMRTVPMASFIILALFWLAPLQLSLVIPFIVVFPLVYTNLLQGFRATPKGLLEMGRVFRLPRGQVFRAILLPSSEAALTSATETGMGMAWKSGITAEIIAMAAPSIGGALYDAKIYLDLSGLLAWTLILLVFSALFQGLFQLVLKTALRGLTQLRPGKRGRVGQSPSQNRPLLSLKEVDKSYGKGPVLDQVTLDFLPGGITFLLGPSGVGKTTLTRLILGLESPDRGKITRSEGLAFSAAFQEDRLISPWTVAQNILLVTPDAGADLDRALDCLGLSGERNSRIDSLSGGMKRRVALIRAGLARADFLIIDEPFRGLDQASREMTWAWLEDEVFPSFSGVLLLFHDLEDLAGLTTPPPADSKLLCLEASGALTDLKIRKRTYEAENHKK